MLAGTILYAYLGSIAQVARGETTTVQKMLYDVGLLATLIVTIWITKIANCIHPYPTQGKAVRKVSELYNKKRFTPGVATILNKVIAWQR